MTHSTRWIYIKNGDVVSQLSRLGECPCDVPEGGTEAFIGDFLRYSCGHHVLLLSCFNRKAYLKKGRVTAYVLAAEARSFCFLSVTRMMRIFQAINAFFIIIAYRPHKIICGSTGPMLWLTWFISKLCRVPWVHSRHNRVTDPRSTFGARLVAAIDGYCMRRAKAVICHGPYLKQQLIEIGIKSSNIHEFDVGFTDFLKQAWQTSPSPKIRSFLNLHFVLFVGRMERYKGIFDILFALEDRLQKPNAPMLIYAGDGNDLRRLKRTVAEKGLAHKIAILGKLTRQEVSVLIRSAKILVAATHSEFPEGRCMAAMEGLALGVPVVAPDFGPFPYLITHWGNGLLYQRDSFKDLKEKLALLLDDETVFQKISKGVNQTRHSIINPTLRFSEAVQRAFIES